MFAHGQIVRDCSAILVALPEDIARVRNLWVGPLSAQPAADIGWRPASSSFSAPTPELRPCLGCGP